MGNINCTVRKPGRSLIECLNLIVPTCQFYNAIRYFDGCGFDLRLGLRNRFSEDRA